MVFKYWPGKPKTRSNIEVLTSFKLALVLMLLAVPLDYNGIVVPQDRIVNYEIARPKKALVTWSCGLIMIYAVLRPYEALVTLSCWSFG